MLDVLLEQKERFDYVLVEATGIADPEAVCEVFWVDEGLGSRVYLDGVICLVDAYHLPLPAELGLAQEAMKQLVCADVLLVNKLDLVGQRELEKGLEDLRRLNPTARRESNGGGRAREALAEPLRGGVGRVGHRNRASGRGTWGRYWVYKPLTRIAGL